MTCCPLMAMDRKLGAAPRIEGIGELGDGQQVGEVTLVILHDGGEGLGVLVVNDQDFVEVGPGEKIVGHLMFLGVGHKYHAVGSLHDRPAGFLVSHLSRNGIELKAHLDPAPAEPRGQREVKIVEKERPILHRVDGHELPLDVRG